MESPHCKDRRRNEPTVANDGAGLCCFPPPPCDRRLWSLYHYRTLLVLYLQIHAHFLFVDILRRGRLFNSYARLLGASVGRDADVATMYFTDHDLVGARDSSTLPSLLLLRSDYSISHVLHRPQPGKR